MIPKTMRLIHWDEPLPEIGHYMRSQGGSMYLVISVKENTRPEPKSVAKLHLLKLTPNDINDVPSDAVIHQVYWMGR